MPSVDWTGKLFAICYLCVRWTQVPLLTARCLASRYRQINAILKEHIYRNITTPNAMKKKEFYFTEYKKYIEENEQIIKSAFKECWANISVKNEIPILKSFLWDEKVGLKYLNSFFKENLNHKKGFPVVNINAIYSHASPRVDFTHDGCNYTRELADLLTILRINVGKENIYSSSFLSQWKLNRSDNKNIGQFYLYNDVENFLMPMWLAGKQEEKRRRQFIKKSNSLNFFYLNERDFDLCHDKVGCHFSELMFDFLNRTYGLSFDPLNWKQQTTIEKKWDKIMKDLLIMGQTRKVDGKSKEIKYLISDSSWEYLIDNFNGKEEDRFQSIMIIDFNYKPQMFLSYKINCYTEGSLNWCKSKIGESWFYDDQTIPPCSPSKSTKPTWLH